LATGIGAIAPLPKEVGQLGAVDVVDVDGLRLGQRAVELHVIGDGLHHDLEAEILGRLVGDLLDRSIRATSMNQGHVLGILRPHGGKSADALSGDGRAAGSSALEKRSTIELVPGFRGAASHLSPLSTPITRWVARTIRKKHAMRFCRQ
jgi:hypothetical protein